MPSIIFLVILEAFEAVKSSLIALMPPTINPITKPASVPVIATNNVVLTPNSRLVP